MRAEVITVGDELLIGQTVNTNAAWIGEALGLVGVDVRRVVVVGDDEIEMKAAINSAVRASRIVIVTGGLGPTHDDITREVVASYFGTELEFHERQFRIVKERFERRGRSVPESNRTQAMIPVGFEVLPNPIGTAPGFWKQIGVERSPSFVAVVPGVPREMKQMVTEQIIPRLKAALKLPVIGHRMIHTTGIGESHLQDELGSVVDMLGNVTLAYLPSLEGVRLRLSVRSEDVHAGTIELDRITEYVVGQLGRLVYSVAGESLEECVGRLLRTAGLTVSVAESCTGGRVLDKLTDVAGSSAYVVGGVVAYSNDVKIDKLGVDSAVLEIHGAVSEAVAIQMARNVRDRLGADIGLASTGILGPGGGSVEKPVGTVWIASSSQAAGERSRLLRLGTHRESNKRRVVAAVLDELRGVLRDFGFSELA